MYRNALTPSKLFALLLIVFAASGLVMWLGSFLDAEMPAFDATGVILLGLALGLFALAILFLRRVRWVRVLTSTVLHILTLVFAASLLYTLPMAEDLTEGAIIVSFTTLGMGLLLVAILALHSDAMKRDMAACGSPSPLRFPRRRRYIAAAMGCMLLVATLAAWQIVPLLVAEPTIAVDCLAQANQRNEPANCDPNRNAAPYYERLFSEFTPLPEVLRSVWKSWPTDLDPNEYKALEEWAPVNESALSVLAEVAQCPYWWFELTSEDGSLSGVRIWRAEESRNCAWGVVLLAKYEASRGNLRRAMQLLDDLHAMGMHRVTTGTLANQMTGSAICGVVHDALFAILAHGEVDRDLLKQTLTALALRVPRIQIPRFSEVEHLYGLDSIQRLFTDDGKGSGRLIPARLHECKKQGSLFTNPLPYPDALLICLRHPTRLDTLLLYEAYFELLRGLAQQTPWDLYTQNTSCEDKIRELTAGNFYLQDGCGAIARCIKLGWRDRLIGEACVTTLAIATYKAQKGRLPESLKQVVDAGLLRSIPMDPYSGAPLVYRVTEDDFTLYSVGEDFVNDEGWSCELEGEVVGDCVFWPLSKPEEGMVEE